MRVMRWCSALAASTLLWAVCADSVWADDTVISATEARTILTEETPGVTAPATPTIIGSSAFSPSLSDRGSYFSIGGSNAEGTVAQDPGEGFVLDGLRVTPLNVDASATQGTLAHDDAAVFANTSQGADTAIRPTAAGIETFTQIREASAPETYAWRISLASGQYLRALPNGDVAVVENRPVASPPAASSGAGETSGDAALTDPVVQLEQARATLATAQRAAGIKVDAVITAPIATDANGTSLPASLSISGDVVTLHVSHQASGTAYPVEVDPKWWAGATIYSGFGPNFETSAVQQVIQRLHDRDNVKFVVLVPQMFQGAQQFDHFGVPDPNSPAGAAYINESLHTSDVRWIDGTTTCSPQSTAAAHYNQGLTNAITYAVGLGMSVVVKPHIDLAYNDTDVGYIRPLPRSRTEIDATDNSDAWWTSYTCKIEAYAQLAESAGATDFVVGTELNLMSDSAPYDNDHWNTIINYARGLNPSDPLQVAYAVNWDATLPSGVADLSQYFFNNLDYIGIDAYWAKGVQNSPFDMVAQGYYNGSTRVLATDAQILTSWGTMTTNPGDPNTNGSQPCPPQIAALPRGRDPNAGYPGGPPSNPGAVVQCLRYRYHKKIVFTELGYPQKNSDPDGTNYSRPSAGYVQAYAFWRSWVKASPGIGTGDLDRCTWFKGIWPWMFGAAGAAGNGYDIRGLDPEDTMVANQEGPTGTCNV